MLARLLTAAALLVAYTAPAHAQISKDAKLLAPFKSVVQKASESTVRIKCNDKETVLGTVVDADGLILTKFSELKGALLAKLSDGSEYEATVVAAHKPTDLALLKIEKKGLKPVTFGDARKLASGSWVAASGPTSDALSVGIVSVMTRRLTGPEAIDINPNRGQLGIYPEDVKDDNNKPLGAKIGAIVPSGPAAKAGLASGDVIVALNGYPVTGQEELRSVLNGFEGGDAITVKAKRKDESKEFKVTLGSAPVERIGITPVSEKDSAGNRVGVKVTAVTTGSPAAKAGLASGDVIRALNGKKVEGQATLRELLDSLDAGVEVTINVQRGDETKSFKVKLGAAVKERDRSDMQNSMGSVLSARRSALGEILQTDLVVDAKDCGGPVVDLDGKVLGINIARAGRVQTWVLPGEVIRPLLTDFKAGKFATPQPVKLPTAPAPRSTTTK